MKRILTAALLAACWATGAGGRDVDLRRVPEHLPYEAWTIAGLNHRANRSPWLGPTAVLYDVDGDGRDELISSQVGYLSAKSHRQGVHLTYYQVNLDPAYADCPDGVAPCALRLCPDLLAPGRTELVAWSALPDGSRFRFWVVAPDSGRVRTTFELSGGRDVRADGVWDGNYFAVGAVTTRRDGEDVRALVVGCNVGYDRYGRGVLAVDPRDGAVLWRFDMGPNPYAPNAGVVDLDGDGRHEIVIAARSPDNLHGELVNGTSDDVSRLFVLDADGRLLWDRELGPAFGTVECLTADLTGDGLAEIVTAHRATPSLAGSLVVWNGRGDILGSTSAYPAPSFPVVARRPDRPSPTLVLTSGPLLLEYELGPAGLRLLRSAELPTPAVVNLVADVLPDPGLETVVSAHESGRYVLDREWQPLLSAPCDASWTHPALHWQPEPDTDILVWLNSSQSPTRIARAPLLAPVRRRDLPLVVGLAGLALAGLGVALLRRRRRRPVAAASPARHDAQLRLLELLELSSHGAIAPLKSVRRLIWHLRAMETQTGDNDRLAYRMRETWTECQDTALPLLDDIAARAGDAGVSEALAAEVRAAVGDLEGEIRELVIGDLGPGRHGALADALEATQARADRTLRSLREQVAAAFRSGVGASVDRVLRAHATELAERRIVVKSGRAAMVAAGGGDHAGDVPADASTDLHVLCDARELDFVVDNLVGNAIAAMADSRERRLGLVWRPIDGMVALEVTDTGCGLPEDQWERALATRFSTRPDGGRGLPASRKLLRKYGGSLAITRSRPGRGTTFRVLLPRA